MTIRWITSLLGTAPAQSVLKESNVEIVDVRDLLDKSGNKKSQIKQKIDLGLSYLKAGKKTVVCCDHGVSRSNSIAAGILAIYENISLDESVKRVLSETGETEIRLEVLEAVRSALEKDAPTNHARKRWLLIGGAGYLGTLLASNIPNNVELLRPSRSELDLLKGSAAINLYTREHEVTRILHFATPNIGNTNTSLGETLVMLRNILDVCSLNQIPLFFLSRWEVFAAYKEKTIFADEKLELCPAGALGDAKYLCEKLIEKWVSNGLVEATVLRSGLVFGVGDAPHFLRSFIRHSVHGEDIITHKYNNGPPKLDLIYASDWIQACWGLLLTNKKGTFNVGGGQLIGTTEIAECVADSLNSHQEVKNILVDALASNVLLNYEKLTNITGWKPTSNIRDKLVEFTKLYANEFVVNDRGIK